MISRCRNCAYWLREASQADQLISGNCHFWPPSGNQEAHKLIPVQFANPRLHELRGQLEAAEHCLHEFRQMNTEAFKSGKTFDQIKKIQKEIEAAERRASDIRTELTRESPYVIEERLIQYQRGCWPVTASDDWCGQWKAVNKDLSEEGRPPGKSNTL